MLITVDMMSTSELEALGPRLERLTGEETTCCLPEYRALAERIARSQRFPELLLQVRAIADEKRLLVVHLLKRRGELCACEVQAAIGVGHATVSHHMRVLTAAGVVRARREGKWAYYRLTPAGRRLLS